MEAISQTPFTCIRYPYPTVSYCFTSDLVVASRNVKGQSNGIDLVKGIYLFLHWRYDQSTDV